MLENQIKKVRKAIIPVAGLGTRFLPQTKAFPKELLPIVDKPVVQYIVQEAVDAGIEEIIFVISEDKMAIEKHFTQNKALEAALVEAGKTEQLASISQLHSMAKFFYVHQYEPLGLGHAVLQARDLIGDEPFMVFGGDDILDCDIPAAQQMISVYEEYNASILGVVRVPEADVVRYGVVDPGAEKEAGVVEVKRVVEKPAVEEAPSQLGIAGRWLLTSDIWSFLEAQEPNNAAGEIYITEAIEEMIENGHTVLAKECEGIYRDCGNKAEYVKAVIAYAMKHPEIGTEITSYIKQLGV